MNMTEPQVASDSTRLADHTTFRIGGPAGSLIVATSESELIAAVQEADQSGSDLLILSGGSNMLVSDQGFPGVVLKVAIQGIATTRTPTGIRLRVAAGQSWDDLVATSVTQGWSGFEMLSGIPGLVGAGPIQNIGAYGVEIASLIHQVNSYDRQTNTKVAFSPEQCGFGYRTSLFKQSPNRYVILSVEYDLMIDSVSRPIQYTDLAQHLGVNIGTRAKLTAVREAVLEVRRSKGMVLDPADHDTWSAGSFFTNPIINETQADQLPTDAPRYLQPDGSIKTSAAWLIEQAGFNKGYGTGPARLSTKHVLALTNHGGATAKDILDLATTIQVKVRNTYGITLTPEPVLVGL